jgi:hypothetical protein
MKKKRDDQTRRCKIVAAMSGLLHHVALIGLGAVVLDGPLLFQIGPESQPAN